MLKGIDPILTPELLMRLCAMGHGEWVAIVDANFTADSLANGRPVIRMPGLSLQRVCQAVLSVFPLDEAVAQPAAYMHHGGKPAAYRTTAQRAFVALLAEQGVRSAQVEAVERFAFYERTRSASLVVQTGELTAYGNALLAKGVILQG